MLGSYQLSPHYIAPHGVGSGVPVFWGCKWKEIRETRGGEDAMNMCSAEVGVLLLGLRGESGVRVWVKSEPHLW